MIALAICLMIALLGVVASVYRIVSGDGHLPSPTPSDSWFWNITM
jgi:hypothetical protein